MHWNKNHVQLTKYLAIVALEVVRLTPSGAACYEACVFGDEGGNTYTGQ